MDEGEDRRSKGVRGRTNWLCDGGLQFTLIEENDMCACCSRVFDTAANPLMCVDFFFCALHPLSWVLVLFSAHFLSLTLRDVIMFSVCENMAAFGHSHTKIYCIYATCGLFECRAGMLAALLSFYLELCTLWGQDYVDTNKEPGAPR